MEYSKGTGQACVYRVFALFKALQASTIGRKGVEGMLAKVQGNQELPGEACGFEGGGGAS
jgi:hypothetical protein